MPTFVEIGQYSIRIYPKDHQPSHVHAVGPDREVKIAIETGDVIENNGVSYRDLKKLVAYVLSHQKELKEMWDEYQG